MQCVAITCQANTFRMNKAENENKNRNRNKNARTRFVQKKREKRISNKYIQSEKTGLVLLFTSPSLYNRLFVCIQCTSVLSEYTCPYNSTAK